LNKLAVSDAKMKNLQERENMPQYPTEYLKGIDLFNEGDFFEAHEYWEELWNVTTGSERLYYQGLIQAAAALIHHYRDNLRGARVCIGKSLEKLESLPPVFMSLDLEKFTAELREFFAYALDETGEAEKDPDRPYPIINI
jgi:hypothetical protein